MKTRQRLAIIVCATTLAVIPTASTSALAHADAGASSSGSESLLGSSCRQASVTRFDPVVAPFGQRGERRRAELPETGRGSGLASIWTPRRASAITKIDGRR